MKKMLKTLSAFMAVVMLLTSLSVAFAAVTPEPTYEWQKEHQALARQLESEAIVLLKNENDLLPLDADSDKVAVFGVGQVSPPGGGGSGGASGAFTSNLMDGLNALGVDYFKELADYVDERVTVSSSGWGGGSTKVEHGWNQETEYPDEWGENASSGSGWNRTSTVQTPEIKLDNGLITDDGIVARAREYADTAIVYISRQTGVEEMDRNPVPQPGDWYLNASERVMLEQVSDKFENIVLIYTGTAPIDLQQFEKYNIKSFIVEYGAGQFHGLAMADILFGVVNPSGKLNDTLVYEYEDHPTNENWGYTSYADTGYDWAANESKYGSRKFSENDPVSVYEEYIYMGYKYFDTFDARVAYPFGFGLSYSDFTFTDLGISADKVNKCLTVEATINNVSPEDVIAGKDVMQVYVSKPQGKMEQAYQNLVAFDKSDALESGESQKMSIDIDFYDFATYDEELAAYVLEAGDYIIRVGDSSRNTHVAGKFRVDETIIVEQLSNQLEMQECNEELYESERLKYADATPITYDGEAEEIANAPVVEIDASYVDQKLEAPQIPTYDEIKELPEDAPTYTFNAVVENQITLGEFVTQFTDEELAIFLSGGVGATYLDEEGNRDSSIQLYASDEPGIPLSKNNSKITVSGGAGSSRSFARLGVPSLTYADGGSGITITLEGTKVNTGWPRPSGMACIWDPELYYLQGVAEGEEMVVANVDNWLAPSINMHRNPLGGRNLEYWSEDPVLTGTAAANIARGVEQSGVSVCLKHFAANDQEWFRRGLYTPASIEAGTSKAAINVIAPERVLREIYLKPFEMAVKTGCVYNVMSAFNSINSQACASSPELLTNILRGEWGFKGYVVTDWGDYDDIADSAMEMAAGNDMIMSGTHTRYNIYDELVEGWEAGKTSREDMLRNAYNVLNTALHSSLAKDNTRHQDVGELRIVTTVLVDAQEGIEYSTVKVSPLWANGSEGTTSYTFALADTSEALPEGMKLAPNGEITGVPADGTAGEYNLVFKVTDSFGNTAEKALTLTVNEGMVFETTELPLAKAAANYNESIVVSGTDSATFAVTAGELPSGMYLTEEGVLSGQPAATSSGVYNFTVTATSGSISASYDYELYVAAALNTDPAVDTVLNAKEGVEFRQEISISGGFTNKISEFTLSELGDALPDGLEISIDTAANKGVISGTPASGTAGTYEIYIYVDEEFGGSPVNGYIRYTIEVSDKLVTATPPEGTVYANDSFTFKVESPVDVIGIKLMNENDKAVTITGLTVEETPSGVVWNITTSVGTAGDRVFKIYTRDIDGNWTDSGERLAVTIESQPVEVKSVEFAVSVVNQNAPVEVNVVTSSTAKTIRLANESDRTIGKKLIATQRTAEGDIVWTYEISIGTKGLGRIITAYAAGSDGVYSDVTAKDFIHVI